MLDIRINSKFKYGLNSLKDRVKSSSIKAFLGTTCEPILLQNIEKTFRQKVFFTGTSTERWIGLRDITRIRRIKKGTWRGPVSSILQEYYSMFTNIKNGSFKRNTSGKNSIGFRPSGKEREKVYAHQKGVAPKGVNPDNWVARPPMTIQKDTIEKLVAATWGHLNI